MIGENLLRFQKDLKIVVADKETEGLHLARSRPWQVSFRVYHGADMVDEFNGFPWWPDLDVSPAAQKVTRFNYFDYKNKSMCPKEARKRWLRYRDDPTYLKVMHNGLGYDSMVDATWAREVGEKPDYSWLDYLIDTNCVAKMQKKGIRPDTSSRRNFRICQAKMCDLVEKGLKTSLTTMGKEFKIEYNYETLHDGLNDIGLNVLVFEKMKWTVEI